MGQYYSHEIDDKTGYCTKCGRFLLLIQEARKWGKKEPKPECVSSGNITAISHLVRKQ